MLTLVPIETYVAKASCPRGPVVLSSLQEARTTRARAPAEKDRLRFITSPQGVEPAWRGGRKQAAVNICNHPKARHPRVRIASPCSSSCGGGDRTDPGPLGGKPGLAFAPR